MTTTEMPQFVSRSDRAAPQPGCPGGRRPRTPEMPGQADPPPSPLCHLRRRRATGRLRDGLTLTHAPTGRSVFSGSAGDVWSVAERVAALDWNFLRTPPGMPASTASTRQGQPPRRRTARPSRPAEELPAHPGYRGEEGIQRAALPMMRSPDRGCSSGATTAPPDPPIPSPLGSRTRTSRARRSPTRNGRLSLICRQPWTSTGTSRSSSAQPARGLGWAARRLEAVLVASQRPSLARDRVGFGRRLVCGRVGLAGSGARNSPRVSR